MTLEDIQKIIHDLADMNLSNDDVRAALRNVAEGIMAGIITPLDEADLLQRIGKKRFDKTTDANMRTLRSEYREIRDSARAEKAKETGRDEYTKDGRLILIDYDIPEAGGETPDVIRSKVANHWFESHGDDNVYFQRGVEIGYLVNGLFQELDTGRFAAEVEKVTLWGHVKRKTLKIEEMPSSLANKLLKDPEFVARHKPLKNSVHVPYVARIGGKMQIVATPGYSDETGILYQPPEGFSIEVPQNVTKEQANEAAASVMWLYADFPLCDGSDNDNQRNGYASCVNIIARDLTAFYSRDVIGNLPIFVISKTEHGSGGTLLSEIGSFIATGQTYVAEAVKERPEEWRKTLFSHALAGTKRLVFDNAPKGYELRDTTMAAAATTQKLSDRVLGCSKVAVGDVGWIIEFNGTNLAFSQEVGRRCVLISINPHMSNPTERTNFRIKNLIEHVKDNRAKIVQAYLTLIQFWIESGCPKWSGQPLASFEGWTETIGGILDCVGLGHHFDANRKKMSPTDQTGRNIFFQAWLEWDRQHQSQSLISWTDYTVTAKAYCGGDFKPPLEIDNPTARVPSNLGELYMHVEGAFVGLAKKRDNFDGFGRSLGAKLSSIQGCSERLLISSSGGFPITYDFELVKLEHDKQGTPYILRRVSGSGRLEYAPGRWCSLTDGQTFTDVLRAAAEEMQALPEEVFFEEV